MTMEQGLRVVGTAEFEDLKTPLSKSSNKKLNIKRKGYA